ASFFPSSLCKNFPVCCNFPAGWPYYSVQRPVCRLIMTEKEYNDCVNLYADNVYRFIVKNLRHEEDARDVVQTAFEKLWRSREEVDGNKSKSYLFTVAYNSMIDHLRKVKRIQLKEDFNENSRVYHREINNT